MAKLSPEDEVKLNDALSYLVPKTVNELATETNLPNSVVKKFLDDMIYKGSVECRGKKYRIEHCGEW